MKPYSLHLPITYLRKPLIPQAPLFFYYNSAPFFQICHINGVMQKEPIGTGISLRLYCLWLHQLVCHRLLVPCAVELRLLVLGLLFGGPCTVEWHLGWFWFTVRINKKPWKAVCITFPLFWDKDLGLQLVGSYGSLQPCHIVVPLDTLIFSSLQWCQGNPVSAPSLPPAFVVIAFL